MPLQNLFCKGILLNQKQKEVISMKRILALLMCIFFLFSILPMAVSANTASLAERVLTMVRSRIPDTSIYSDFSSSVSVENDRTVYHFNWSDTSNGNYKGMYVTALNNGIIISFGINEGKTDDNNTSVGFDRISKEEAQNKAKELLKTLNPDIANNLSLKPIDEVEQFDAQSHSFAITHMESGIPVYGDRGRVTVDINAEKITGFSLTYTDKLSYPSPVKIIDLATAKSVFTEDIGLDLYYRVWQDNEKKVHKIFPVYSPKNDNVYVNASTGTAEKIIPFSEDIFAKEESADGSLSGSNSLGLTPAELKEIQNLKKLLSQKDAEAYVRKIDLLNISQAYELEEFSTRKLSSIEELYGHSLVFCHRGDERNSYIFVDINAETGEVLSYSNFTPDKDESSISDSDIEALFNNVIKALAPQKYSEYQLRPSNGDKHYAVYDRYANGIRVDGNTVSIEIGPSGALASYRITYTNATFPMYSDILSVKQTAEKLFDTAKYTLMYIPQKSSDALKRPDEAVLIYALDNYSIYLDPYTGKRINADGTEYIAENVSDEYMDISGHYAEDKIKALRRFGIGFDDSEFKPDTPCTQKDFITLLTAAFGTKNVALINADTNSSDYYSEAKSLGIIKDDEISPDSMVTRMQAAKFICRALKIEKFAQLDKIFSCPFNDVTNGKGYVTLLWGMGIVNGTGQNTFSPNDSLTRGQTAILIYNAMSNK